MEDRGSNFTMCMAIPFKNCLCEEKTDHDSHSPSNNSKQTDLTEQKKHPNDLTLD